MNTRKFKLFLEGAGIGLLFIIGIILVPIFIVETAIYLGPIIGISSIIIAGAIIGISFIITIGVMHATIGY